MDVKMTNSRKDDLISAETTIRCEKSAESEGLVQEKICLWKCAVQPLYGHFAEACTEKKVFLSGGRPRDVREMGDGGRCRIF